MVGQTALLTGGTGLTGREIAHAMTEAGWSVRHLSRSDPADGNEWIAGDIVDRSTVELAVTGCDVVVHAAALHGGSWSEAGDDSAFRVNVDGTLNVLEAAVAVGVARVVFTSSIWAAGHGLDTPYLPIDEDLPREPAELYGLTKVLGERMCRYVTARGGVSTLCLRAGYIRPGDAWQPGVAEYLFGAVDARDVAQAHLLAAQAPESLGHEVCIVTAESPLAALDHTAYRASPIAAVGRVAPEVAAMARSGTIDLPLHAEYYSIERAQRLLGYEPRFGFLPA